MLTWTDSPFLFPSKNIKLEPLNDDQANTHCGVLGKLRSSPLNCFSTILEHQQSMHRCPCEKLEQHVYPHMR